MIHDCLTNPTVISNAIIIGILAKVALGGAIYGNSKDGGHDDLTTDEIKTRTAFQKKRMGCGIFSIIVGVLVGYLWISTSNKKSKRDVGVDTRVQYSFGVLAGLLVTYGIYVISTNLICPLDTIKSSIDPIKFTESYMVNNRWIQLATAVIMCVGAMISMSLSCTDKVAMGR
jgi:hypothetical protein